MKKIVSMLVMVLMCMLLTAYASSENTPAGNIGAPSYDFKALKSQNSDIYACISISDSDVDYPVAQCSTDDTYYLTHNIDGLISNMGAIFTESAYNKKSFDEMITVIYGNRMKSGDMFGGLQLMFSEKNALDKYGEIIISQPGSERHFTVFAACPYDDRHIMYNYGDGSECSISAFLSSLISQRRIDSIIDRTRFPVPGEKIIVLSTCLYDDNDKRFIVAAKESNNDNSASAFADNNVKTDGRGYVLSPEREREIIITDIEVEDNEIIETVRDVSLEKGKTQLILTPFERKNDIDIGVIKERIEAAMVEIDNCSNLGEIVPELETIKNELNNGSKGINAEPLKINDFYVYDLFDVSLMDGENMITSTENICAHIKWQTTLQPGDDCNVFHKTEVGGWKNVKIDKLNEDGELTVTLPGLGCNMIVCHTNYDKFYNSADVPKSPLTAE